MILVEMLFPISGTCPDETHFRHLEKWVRSSRQIKWRQRHDMALAVDWDVKHQFKQTNKQTNKLPVQHALSVHDSFPVLDNSIANDGSSLNHKSRCIGKKIPFLSVFFTLGLEWIYL